MSEERVFMELLAARWAKNRFVCIGLDSEYAKIPDHIKRLVFKGVTLEQGALHDFNNQIIDATADIVCTYKPNFAFYLALGPKGLEVLEWTIEHLHNVAPEVPVILDVKWADIGNTNRGYVDYAFKQLGVDAVTLNPYLGREALKPFLEMQNKGFFILAQTSNPGADEFQGLTLDGGGELSYVVAREIAQGWNGNGNCGVVVGATYPHELESIREAVEDMPILIPGIGAQGGDVEATVKAGLNKAGTGIIVNSSRGIIFASGDRDFADVARAETLKLNAQINECRDQ